MGTFRLRVLYRGSPRRGAVIGRQAGLDPISIEPSEGGATLTLEFPNGDLLADAQRRIRRRYPNVQDVKIEVG